VASDWVWQTGGIKFGAWYMTWPAATLSISSEGLHLKLLVFWQYEIPRSSICLLKRAMGLVSSGLEVKHSCEGLPPSFIFWSLDIARLEEALKVRGYALESATSP